MSKANLTHLLLPGESGWESWAVHPQQGEAKWLATHEVSKPSEIEKLPQGDLVFFFPVKTFTALPQRVPTTDPSLFEDLATTHAERLGFRPDPMSGQLTDVFPLASQDGESVFLSVVLRTPQSPDLPSRSPKAFDLSPRAFAVSGNTLAIWRELGSWVFAIFAEGKLLYCQATNLSSPAPDGSLIREIRIATAHLSIHGIDAAPTAAIVWSSDPETDTLPLSNGLSLPTSLIPRPNPGLPQPASKLLPADVRAARRAARKRQNTLLAIAAIAVLYFGTIAYLGFKLWNTRSVTQKLLAQVQAVAPQGNAYAEHIAKWDELEHAIDLNHNTLDILNRIARSIPPNSGLRLRSADITATDIVLLGEAPQPQAINDFSKNLAHNNDLAAFTWDTRPATQSSRGWEFDFTATTRTTTP